VLCESWHSMHICHMFYLQCIACSQHLVIIIKNCYSLLEIDLVFLVTCASCWVTRVYHYSNLALILLTCVFFSSVLLFSILSVKVCDLFIHVEAVSLYVSNIVVFVLPIGCRVVHWYFILSLLRIRRTSLNKLWCWLCKCSVTQEGGVSVLMLQCCI
jgi:hypothetical protein